MPIWHSVISVSGTRVRYNPCTQELRLVCAKRVPIRLTELLDFYVIQVSLSSHNRSSWSKLNPPNPPEFVKLSDQNLDPLRKRLEVEYGKYG